MKAKTEERSYAEDVLKQAKSKWGNGWNILSERDRHAECGLIFMTLIISQQDPRQHIGF